MPRKDVRSVLENMVARTKLAAALLAVACVALVLACGVLSPARAYAQEGDELPDVMLAVFTNSQNDGTDSIYMSVDGYHFELISEAFVNLDRNNPADVRAVGSGTVENPVVVAEGWQRTWPLYSFSCPSIIYHNGYFWMLANEANSGDDGTLRLVVSNSKDLVHWCDQRQVKVNVAGGWVDNGTPGQFDAVAADWAVGDDGNIYVAVSLGRYGDYHGDAENDQMSPYLVKITELSATNDPAENPILNDAAYITVAAQTAVPINLPLSDSNRIDGSFYFENGLAYLSIKRNGVTNEIWSTSNLDNASDPAAWQGVCSNVVTGYEAPSLTKFNGNYFFYTDQLATWTPDDHVRLPYYSTGTFVQTSKSLSGGWTYECLLQAYTASGQNMVLNQPNNVNGDGPRHGTVITVTDPTAKQIIWAQRANAGWTSDPVSCPTFADVDYSGVGDWGWMGEWVNKAASMGLMTGIRDSVTQELTGLFAPQNSLTRAQAILVLYRASTGASDTEKAGANTTPFTDVNSNDYYTNAVNWAYKKGIVKGFADAPNEFRPDAVITRQELAIMLWRSCGKPKATDGYAAYNACADAGAEWDDATEALAWTASLNILSGSVTPSGTFFNAYDPALRCQGAKIFSQGYDYLVRD